MKDVARRTVREGRQLASALGETLGVARELAPRLKLADLRSGRWFDKLAREVLERRSRLGSAGEAHQPGEATLQADKLIRKACVESAALGSGAAAIATGATVVTAQTDGALGLVALPAAAISVGVETIARVIVQFRLACDLGELLGSPLSAEDPAELARLCAIGLGVLEQRSADDLGKGLVERAVRLGEDDGLAREVGSRLLFESVVKSAIPVFGLVTSSARSWRVTRRLGETVSDHLRYRGAMDSAFEAAEGDFARETLIEGLWFIFTADGPLTAPEASVLSHFVRRCPAEARDELLARFVRDEAEWLQTCKRLPVEARAPILRALEIAAAIDDQITSTEREIVGRVASVLDQPFDPEELEDLARRLHATGTASVH
jgi:hypothetical protein